MIQRPTLLVFAAITLAMFVSAAAIAAPPAGADDSFGGSIGVKVGQKTLHKNDWDPIQTQTGLGAMINLGQKSWPVMIALDADYTFASKTENGETVKGTTTEVSLGARAPIPIQGVPIQPYVGGGVSYGTVTIKASGLISGNTTLTGYGPWIDGGAQYIINGALGIGLDVRYDSCPTKKTENGFTAHIEAGGFEPAVTVAAHF